jgi:hypothetical protein
VCSYKKRPVSRPECNMFATDDQLELVRVVIIVVVVLLEHWFLIAE